MVGCAALSRLDDLSPAAQLVVAALVADGVPSVGVQLVVLCYLAGLIEGCPTVSAVEFFAGERAVSKGLIARGFPTYSFELKHDAVSHDIMGAAGFAHAVSLVMRVEECGLLWFGIVCSSWIWMCRRSVGRDLHILGNGSDVCKNANAMVSRVMLLIRIGRARRLVSVLEQPLSSIMSLHHRFQQWLQNTLVWVTKCHLGHFGGESHKTVMLYCDRQFIGEVNAHIVRDWSPASVGIASSSLRDDGTRAVHGGPRLKDTQSYPVLFGAAVATVYNKFRPALLAEPRPVRAVLELTVDAVVGPSDGDMWADALLGPCFELLMAMADS